MRKKFSWQRYPSTEEEFEKMMAAIDADISAEDIKPHQRPHHVGFRLWEAFEWGGNALPPSSLANEPGYQGDVLLAKAFRWYEQTQGARLKVSMHMAQVPIMLLRSVWRLKIIEWFGSVNFFLNRNLSNTSQHGIQGSPLPGVNVLTLVEQLPQGAVERLSDAELIKLFEFYHFSMRAIEWRNNLPLTPLLRIAKGDFDGSCEDIFAGRYPQARWAAQQAVEKTIKGLLVIGGTPYPTGRDGHDLKALALILHDKHAIDIDPEAIASAYTSTNVRYEEKPSTVAEAIKANHAALSVFHAIKDSAGFEPLMQKGMLEGRQ